MAKPYLCIDFYKTLSFDHLWHAAPGGIEKEIEELLFTNLTSGSIADMWMRGKISSEEVNHFVADRLSLPYEQLWDFFIESTKTLRINTEALEHIVHLRDRYTPVLITDNMDSFSRFTVPVQKLDTVFDFIINSADVGKLKGDTTADLFTKIADDFTGSILIDDSERNCEKFRLRGGIAYQVTKQDTIITHLLQLTSASVS